MHNHEQIQISHNRYAPLEMSSAEFRQLGYMLVDQIADFLQSLPQHPVTPAESPQVVRKLIGTGAIPEHGTPAQQLIEETAELLFDHSLFNGHPRFWGYITSSAAPIGALADLLASAINPNVGAFILSPLASEIEAQTIRWIADLIGFPRTCGGVLVSGGNMANFIGFLTARQAKADWDIKREGMSAHHPRMMVYVSKATHTWIHKASELFGMGEDAVRWIETDTDQRMDVGELEKQIVADRGAGLTPFLVVGTAGTVSVGAVDPLVAIAAICKKYDLWFHVDGAYGAPVAVLPNAPADLRGLSEADSIALDPHKWLYSPLEAGCTLVRNPQHMIDAYSHHPDYYNFDGTKEDPPINYLDFGLQNSRGFRALKVWLGLRQAGRQGYIQMIRDDIALAQALYKVVDAHPELQAVTQNLSITTFRFVPPDLSGKATELAAYLNKLNEELVNRLQASGEAFVSNAVVDGNYLLRACIVNFRTSLADVEALPEIVSRIGRQVDTELRPQEFSNREE
jgi:glutamate/tyrosine decarboxylase-like PLP-dependent enzyme